MLFEGVENLNKSIVKYMNSFVIGYEKNESK